MPVLNFNVFVEKVESGKKTQTIRLKRKHPIGIGDKLYLYTRMMHKDCRKLGEAVCCQVHPIKIFLSMRGLKVYCYSTFWRMLSVEQKSKLAIDDGFENVKDFDDYFIKSCKMKPGDIVEADVIYWDKMQTERG